MKKLIAPFVLTVGLAASSAWAAGFTPGNVVVLQCTNSSTGGGGSLIEYNQAGVKGIEVPLPFNGATDSGTSIVFGNNSTLNHDATLSGDGAFVVVGGYANTATGVDSAAGTISPRVVALVKYDGTYTRPFSSTTALSGTSVRSATSDGFGNFWGNGNGAPTYLNTATAVRSGSVRVTAIFNGNLYYSAAAGAFGYAGTPTTLVGDGSSVLASSGSSPSGYAFPANPVEGSKAYMADYNNATGIAHFEMEFGYWVWKYNILLAGGEKPQHIAVDFSGANPVIYVTPTAATGNHLYAIVDSGSATYSQTTVATAASGMVFRGVAMAPTVPGAPVFTVQPLGQTNNYGDNVTFGPVAASGANPNGFTWRRSGTNLIDGPTGTGSVISGATSNTLTISSIGIADRGCYYAVAQNNGPNTATSDCAFLDLIGSCINPKPLPATLCAGSTANFIGGTAGCPQPVTSPSWTWNAGFGDIPVNDGPGPSGSSTVSGATTTSLTIANVQDGDAGLYKLTVIDGLSQPSVAGAALVVADPPSFVSQPVNQTKVAGQTASFEVVASGNALTYVWKKNASPINDGPTGNGSTIAGAHTATLWITNVVGQDVGTYTCTVSNVCGTLTSDPATLTVGYAPVITVPPVSLIVTAGQTAVFTATVTGTELINYSWKHNADTIGDDGHYSGTGTPTLTVNNVQMADAQSYTITAVNDYGTASATAVIRFVLAQPQPSGIPGLVIYEPFNYPDQAYAQNAPINSFQDIISTWNQITGEPAWWERLGQGSSTVRSSGIPIWPGIDCINDREWYWSSAPNNNHLKFGGIDQTKGAAYFSFVFNAGQGARMDDPGSIDRYDTIAGLTTGEGAANADNWVYRLCTHVCATAGCNSFQLGVFKGGGGNPSASSVNGQWAPIDLSNGAWNGTRGVGTHFIVGCYKFNSGTNLVGGSITNDDVISLWIDPDRSYFGASEGSLPPPSAGGMVTNWAPNAPITEFALKGTLPPASRTITDLRIGTTWASVTHPYYPTIRYSRDALSSLLTLKWPAKDSAELQGGNGYSLKESLDLSTWATPSGAVTQDGTNAVYGVSTSPGSGFPPFYRLALPLP